MAALGDRPAGEVTTRDAKTFTGRIVKENGQIVLKDLVTKVSYKLSDTTKAKQYMGRQVKATGKLDMNSNTILVQRIEPASHGLEEIHRANNSRRGSGLIDQ